MSPAGSAVAPPDTVSGGVVGQAALWLLLVGVIAIVRHWERQPLGSLGFRPLRWPSLGWAGVLALVSVLIIFPATERVRMAFGLSGYAAGMEAALVHPWWLRVTAVVTAGVVEETLFRGFTVTRLLQLGCGLPAAVGVSSAAFAALHLPHWGPGPSLALFLGGLATTAFFVWRRDLLAMILAHIAIDLWALVITPATSRWWE